MRFFRYFYSWAGIFSPKQPNESINTKILRIYSNKVLKYIFSYNPPFFFFQHHIPR